MATNFKMLSNAPVKHCTTNIEALPRSSPDTRIWVERIWAYINQFLKHRIKYSQKNAKQIVETTLL